MRHLLEEVRRDERDHAETDRDRDDEQVVAVAREIDAAEDARAGGADHAEHHEAGPAEHALRHGLDQGRELRDEPEAEHDEARGHRHPARADAGDADEPDILRERGVGKRVEDAADDGAEPVRAQSPGQPRLVDRVGGDLRQRQEHAGGLDHHDDHHEAQGDDRDRIEGRPAEGEGAHDVEPGRRGDAVELHQPGQAGQDHAERDPDQHRGRGDEAGGVAGDGEDRAEHEGRDAEIEGRTVVRVADAAGGPVHADAHQRDADDEDDGAGHDRREQRQEASDQRGRQEAEQTGGDDGAVDAGEADRRVHPHGEHRADGREGHAHHHRHTDADAGQAPALDQRDDAAGEQIGADQHGDLLGRQFERPADDERDRHGARIHHEHVLQPEEAEGRAGNPSLGLGRPTLDLGRTGRRGRRHRHHRGPAPNVRARSSAGGGAGCRLLSRSRASPGPTTA